MHNVKIFFGIFLLGIVILVGSTLYTKPVEELAPLSGEADFVEESGERVSVVATDLDTPWEIVLLPDGRILTALRGGMVRIVGESGTSEFTVPDVVERGEGGLLGVVLHPDFVRNNYIYFYLTTSVSGQTINRIVRYTFDGTSIMSPYMVLDNIPGGSNHNGGRIAFGPDNLLYVTTGDAGRENLAQERSSLAGKILRLRDDGSVPEDNPFGDAVYSYGHRNPQGLAWDSKGRLWATEHGRSGILSGYDEINLIEAGINYGWPVIQGDETREGMRAPIVHSGASTTWAPAGMAYSNGALYFAGLRGRALYKMVLQNNGGMFEVEPLFEGEFGRLRAVVADSRADLYVSTSNRDGRGSPQAGDDKILRFTIPLE